MPEITQPSFAAGEMSPALYARVDLARYYTGLKTCRNFIVKATGGVVNRPGSRFIASTKDQTKTSRLIEFRFSSSQVYALEFGDYYMRVIYRGGLVLTDEDAVFELTTIYPSSALRGIDFTQNADIMTICHPSYPQQQLSRYAHNDWRISAFANVGGPFGDMNIDTAKTISASAETGNVTLTSPEDIFTEAMVGQMIQIEQHPESLYAQWEVSAIINAGEVKKTDTGYYQAVSSGTTGTVRPDHLEGRAFDGNPGVSWEFLHNGSGIVLITGFTDVNTVTGTVLSRLPRPVVVGEVGRAIQGLTPATVDKDVIITLVEHGYPPSGWLPSEATTVDVAGVVGTTGANDTWPIDVIDANRFYLVGCTDDTPYVSGGVVSSTFEDKATYKWSLEAWGGDQGYPATSSYYQQRQIFGGTPGRPQAIQMSRSGGFLDFGVNNPSLDDDAISFSLNSGAVGQIQHFVGLKQLIALTTEGPWMITKEQGNPIPITEPQGEGGSATVRPLKINKQALYVEDKGGAVRALGYEFSSDTYEGKDLTITADHLFEGHQIVEWAYQKIPNRCIWMVRDDGILIGLTYMVEQEVVAWHRHDTDGYVESVTCVAEEKEDAVYLVVRREIGGVTKRYIERMETRNFPTRADAFFVDSGLTYDGRGAGDSITWTLSGGTNWGYTESLTFTTDTNLFVGTSDINDCIVVTLEDGSLLRLRITGYTSSKVVTVQASKTVPAELRNIAQTGFDLARDTIAGLGHLEGKTVSILADTKVAPQQTVTNGTIVLQNAAVVVHAGLPITSDLETLEINIQGNSIQDRVKNINSVSVIVRDTRGLLAGTDESNLLETRTEIGTSTDDLYQDTTGNMSVNVISDWDKSARVMIRQEDPLPATILAIIPNVAVSGS